VRVRIGIPCRPRTAAKRSYLQRRAAARLPRTFNAANQRLYRLCRCLPDDAVREASLRAMPSRSVSLAKGIRRLARSLKAIDRTASAFDYLPVVSEWIKTACPKGGEGVWPWFVAEYEAADGTSPRAFADRIRSVVAAEDLVGETAVCRAVQLMADRFGRTVYISARVLSQCTGIPKSTCAEHLKRLVKRNVIRIVEKGMPEAFTRLATVFEVSGLFAVGDAAERQAAGSGSATSAEDQSGPPPVEHSRPEPAVGSGDLSEGEKKQGDLTCVQTLQNQGKECRGGGGGGPLEDGPGWSEELTPGQRAALEARKRRLELMNATPEPW